MKANESKIIKSQSNRSLTALGVNLKHRVFVSACECNGFNRFNAPSELRTKVDELFNSMVFDHKLSYDTINTFFKQIN